MKILLLTLLITLPFLAQGQIPKYHVNKKPTWHYKGVSVKDSITIGNRPIFNMCDTCKATSSSNYATLLLTPMKWEPAHYIFFNTPQEIMRISAPDSNRIITVRFNKHLVHFINDSTFTFKQP